MSNVVVDNYIKIASGILFYKGNESDLAVNKAFEYQQFSGFKTSDSQRKDKASSKFMP